MIDAPRSPSTRSVSQRLRRWRDGVLTASAFALVAALVFGTVPGIRPAAAPDRLAEVSLAR